MRVQAVHVESNGEWERTVPAIGTNCFTCQARHRTEWCVLSDDELRLIDDNRVGRELLPVEVLFNEGDDCRGVYCVEYGLLGIRKYDADGNSILLHLSMPGETLGYRALLTDTDFKASAEALEPSRVCFIGKRTVRNLLEQNPALGLRFLKRASNELEEAEEKIFHNVTLSVRARFAHLLAVLIDRALSGTDGNAGAEIRLPISRTDMASMIGTTPESVSRTIRKLEDEGIVQFSGAGGRTLTVPDLETLANEFGPQEYF